MQGEIRRIDGKNNFLGQNHKDTQSIETGTFQIQKRHRQIPPSLGSASTLLITSQFH